MSGKPQIEHRPPATGIPHKSAHKRTKPHKSAHIPHKYVRYNRPPPHVRNAQQRTKTYKSTHIYAWEQKNTITRQPEHQPYPSPLSDTAKGAHTHAQPHETTQPDQTR